MTTGGRMPEFTYGYYRAFLHRLCQEYEPTTFKEGPRRARDAKTPLLILRHDIDMGLEAAAMMAHIESDLGVRSTYFFMVTCPLYNVFSREGMEYVREILSARHHFGLHFDCASYRDVSPSNLDDLVSRECALLESQFGSIEAVSFHRPGPLELSGLKLKRLPNSYEIVFREEFQYFADSRGRWSRGNPLESETFRKRGNLHICIHPIWWSPEPRTPFECLLDLVKRISIRTEECLSDNCQVWKEGRDSAPIQP